jgi:3-hydroxybutyryl-CoA dehydrogenase
MNASEVKVFGVIGAGQMGAGIAQVAATAGLSVLLLDANPAIAEKAIAKIGAILGKQVEKGKLEAATKDAIVGRIKAIGSAKELAPADIVVEAATENLELKLRILKDADENTREDALLASNTSSISITKLAAVVNRPDLFVGMHFMNPVPLMKLVEIIRGVQTSSAAYETVKELAERLGKTVNTSKDAPGFLVNRMLIPFLNEACFALQEGTGTVEDIDTGAKLGLAHPMGPFELADLIGLDTVLAIAEVLHREIGDDKYRAPTLLRNLVAAGYVGKKGGRGFYVYDEKGQRQGSSLTETNASSGR